MDKSTAIRESDGQLALDDSPSPDMVRAANKRNCRIALEKNAERINYFKHRIWDRGLTALDVVIVVLKIDDANGGKIADILMPNFNWQMIRDKGGIPFAGGFTARQGIQKALESFDKEASEKLQAMADLAVVVVDYGVAEVFPA